MVVKKSVINYLPVILTDSTDMKTSKTLVAFGAVTVNYAKQGDVALTTKVLLITDWIELGLGLYLIKFSATELSVPGLFYYVVNSAGCLDYYGCVEIQNTINDDMVDAVWDEPKADHTGNTTMGDIATEVDKINAMNATVDNIFDDVGDVEAKVDILQTTASAILVDTNETQGKLPLNKIMGSSTTANKDTVIDAIKLKTDLIPADPVSTASINAQLTLMKSTTTGTYDRDTDSLEAIKDKVDTLVVSGELKNFNIAGK